MGTQSTLVAQVSRPTYWDQAIGPPDIAFPEYPVPSPLDEYLFDLQGFVLLPGALSTRGGGRVQRRCGQHPKVIGAPRVVGQCPAGGPPRASGPQLPADLRVGSGL